MLGDGMNKIEKILKEVTWWLLIFTFSVATSGIIVTVKEINDIAVDAAQALILWGEVGVALALTRCAFLQKAGHYDNFWDE